MSTNNNDQKRDSIIPENVIEYISTIKQTMQPFVQMREQLEKVMESLNSQIQLIHKVFNPILEQQQQFVEFAKRVIEQEKIKKEAMLKSGWWLTPSLMEMPANLVLETANDYLKGNRVAITSLFRKVYQRKNCRYLEDIVADWKANKLLSPWGKHIANALYAHKNKKYTLSVPVLLLVAEGLATVFCKKHNIYKKSDEAKGGEKIKKALRQHYRQSSWPLSYLDTLEYALTSTIYQKTYLINKLAARNILNRHAILHGLKKNYGTVKISLQAFMLLDVLSELE